MWRVLPEFCAAHPRYERTGLRDLCQSIHDMYAKGDIARLVTEMYLSDLQPAMKPSDAFARIAHRETERVDIDALEGRITTSLLTPYPPGIPLLIPASASTRRSSTSCASRGSSTQPSRASTPTCTGWWSKTTARRRARATTSTAYRRALSRRRRTAQARRPRRPLGRPVGPGPPPRSPG